MSSSVLRQRVPPTMHARYCEFGPLGRRIPSGTDEPVGAHWQCVDVVISWSRRRLGAWSKDERACSHAGGPIGRGQPIWRDRTPAAPVRQRCTGSARPCVGAVREDGLKFRQ
jgi:hypothetical protein